MRNILPFSSVLKNAIDKSLEFFESQGYRLVEIHTDPNIMFAWRLIDKETEMESARFSVLKELSGIVKLIVRLDRNDKNVKKHAFLTEGVSVEQYQKYHKNIIFCLESEFDPDGGAFLDFVKSHKAILKITWKEINVGAMRFCEVDPKMGDRHHPLHSTKKYLLHIV